MSTEYYPATSLIGGASGALDAIGSGTLGDGDVAIVTTATEFYVYRYDSSSTTAENSPQVIAPDDIGNGGRWLLVFTSTYVQTRNILINGNAKIWQEGTSFDSTTTPSNSDGEYLADQWVILSDGDDIVDVSQETTVIPTNSYAAFKFLITATNNKKFGWFQPLHSQRCNKIIGDVASLSFKARIATGSTSIDHLRAAVVAWDGVENTITLDVVDAGNWNAAGTDPTLDTNWTYENTPTNLATLTDSYQTFKIENISIDTANTKNVGVFIWSDDVTTTAGHILYLADIQLVPGPIAIESEDRDFSEELLLCQPYMCKSYDHGDVPGTVTPNGTTYLLITELNSAGHGISLATKFPVAMWTTPSVISYSPTSGTGGRVDMAVNDRGATIAEQSETGFKVTGNSDASTNRAFVYHYVAKARL